MLDTLAALLLSGWLSLLDYLAAHVLLCLVPAFVIAGYLSAMIPKEAVTRFLGPRASRWISYPAAALGGFVLAVCSCTILPLFAGIWRRGAGLGPAVTFLFVGPAINILAITYTGAAIGFDIAAARLILSIFFGILIGLLMAWFFRNEEAQRGPDVDSRAFEQKAEVRRPIWVVLGLLVALLIAGTLQVPLFTHVLARVQLPLSLSQGFWGVLSAAHLTPQGFTLIGLLVILGGLAWKGFENIYDGFTGWSRAALVVAALTILTASPVEEAGSLILGINGRSLAVLFLLAALGWTAWRYFSPEELAGWIWESWKFVKQIFPLLVVGVFAAGILRALIPEIWVKTIAGENTVWANLVGVLFGVFMYFPTLVEVPIAKMFLDLGMARGPLLAYLLADPELSLQSILVLNGIMGRKKTAVYVALVAVLSTLAGYLFGLALTLL